METVRDMPGEADEVPVLLRGRVPERLWLGLNGEQRRLLADTLRMAQTRHALEYRVSLDTIFWGRCYVTLFAGPERRNPERLAAEGQTALPRQAALVFSVVGLIASYALFGALAFIYLLKGALGIDLSEDASWFHPLYALLFER